LLCAVGLATPSTATATPRTRASRSARSALTVLNANVEEYLSVKDNHAPHDLHNFAHRVRTVLTEQADAGAPVHTPDLVFLQEVDAHTLRAVRIRLDHVLGAHYALAGGRRLGPARGRGAILRHRNHRHALLTRATAVLYNTATVHRPSSAHAITFRYPRWQMWTKRSCHRARVRTGATCQANMWEYRQSMFFHVRAKRSGRLYAVASVHFVPYRFLRPIVRAGQRPGFREGLWLRALASTLHRRYPHSAVVLGGDFNDRVCVQTHTRAGSPRCATPAQYTPLYRAARWAGYQDAIGLGIDHIITSRTVLAAGRDDTYKATLGSTKDFERCEALYNRGTGMSRRAAREPGCTAGFYSDHPLDWAVIG
jgi:hypothetical protein